VSALDGLLGRHGDPVECHPGEHISMHWWLGDAKPGDPCLCGETRKQPESSRPQGDE
jgi:hypothetical protein